MDAIEESGSTGEVASILNKPNQLQICLLLYKTAEGNEWLLPKGRKDLGETLEATAARETFEETGYPCEIVPVRMMTRALDPRLFMEDIRRVVGSCKEPFAVTVRELEEGYTDVGAKIIWWFITRLKGKKVEGTQGANENFTSHLANADDAVEVLTFAEDRQLARRALDIVRATEADGVPII